GAAGAKGDKGDVGNGFFEWFSSAKGDLNKDGTIDDKDVLQWLKGDTGAKGDTGMKGETGATGAKGETGMKGETGDKGDAGTPMPVMIQPGTHMGTDNNGHNVKLKDWSGINDSKVTLWKSFDGAGDIQLWGMQKQDDGAFAATSGREWVHGQGWKPLVDANGDGFVFKVGTQNDDGGFSFWADRSNGQPFDGVLY
ncbi:MAG: collagen-like protein, partial [Cocleimonas sp.]|nr:collagen-like protein [Cocleimonas sp.]